MENIDAVLVQTTLDRCIDSLECLISQGGEFGKRAIDVARRMLDMRIRKLGRKYPSDGLRDKYGRLLRSAIRSGQIPFINSLLSYERYFHGVFVPVPDNKFENLPDIGEITDREISDSYLECAFYSGLPEIIERVIRCGRIQGNAYDVNLKEVHQFTLNRLFSQLVRGLQMPLKYDSYRFQPADRKRLHHVHYYVVGFLSNGLTEKHSIMNSGVLDSEVEIIRAVLAFYPDIDVVIKIFYLNMGNIPVLKMVLDILPLMDCDMKFNEKLDFIKSNVSFSGFPISYELFSSYYV
jgi:hypothetical protein